MSLRIPLTRDQTLQTEFHEIERRLRRLEGRTGITQEGSRATINLIGGSGGTVNLTSIINRIEALEEAVENLPDPVTYRDYGLVGSTSTQGLVPAPGVRGAPTGVAQHIITEDHYWGFPHRGLVQVTTDGATAQAEHLNVMGSLSVNGELTATNAPRGGSQAMTCVQDPLLHINTASLLIRLPIIISCVVAIIAFHIWGARTERRWEPAAVILWLFNVLAFHIPRLFCTGFSVEFYNNWSLGIHLHAALGCAIAGAWLARIRKL